MCQPEPPPRHPSPIDMAAGPIDGIHASNSRGRLGRFPRAQECTERLPCAIAAWRIEADEWPLQRQIWHHWLSKKPKDLSNFDDLHDSTGLAAWQGVTVSPCSTIGAIPVRTWLDPRSARQVEGRSICDLPFGTQLGVSMH